MQTITAKQGQSFIDLVNESTGNAENLFAMALANNVSPTAIPEIGRVYIAAGIVRSAITRLYGVRYCPATLFLDDENTGPAQLDYIFPQIFPAL